MSYVTYTSYVSFMTHAICNLHNMQNNQFLKVKNSLLELEKGFIELKIENRKIEKWKLKER